MAIQKYQFASLRNSLNVFSAIIVYCATRENKFFTRVAHDFFSIVRRKKSDYNSKNTGDWSCFFSRFRSCYLGEKFIYFK